MGRRERFAAAAQMDTLEPRVLLHNSLAAAAEQSHEPACNSTLPMAAGDDHHDDHDDHDHEPDDRGEILHEIPREPEGWDPIANENNGPEQAPPFALSQTFELASNPNSNYTIYLDFDGHITEGTTWNNANLPVIDSPAYSLDNNPAFNSTELERIQLVWQRVADDFAPFDVNVTTIEPSVEDLRKRGTGDTKWGVRVVMTDDLYFNCGCGGHAYLNSFEDPQDEPTFVYNKGLSGVSEAVTHEVGHMLGLSHDGYVGGPTYSSGHGSGTTGWGPVMGAPYSKTTVQWSAGDYYNGNQTQDDLDIITTRNGFGYRTDDHLDTISGATELRVENGAVADHGIISTGDDRDVFTFVHNGGQLQLSINPLIATRGNLDVWAGLYDAGGTFLAESNRSGDKTAGFNQPLAPGRYYLKIDGVGTHGTYNAATERVEDPVGTAAPWRVQNPTGYSDYGSLGQYQIFGNLGNAATTQLSIAANQTALPEGESGTTPFTFTVTRTGDLGVSSSVAWAARSITTNVPGSPVVPSAIGNDFGGGLPTGTVTFAPGQSTQTITVNVAGDTLVEPDEVFAVRLSDAVNAGLLESEATSTIIADESSIALVENEVVGREGDPSSPRTLSFTVQRSNVFSAAATVDWAISAIGGSPVTAADFPGGVFPSGTLAFAAGQQTATIQVPIAGDTLRESEETFLLTLSNAQGSESPQIVAGREIATGRITDDDDIVSLRGGTLIRFRQSAHSGNSFDNMAIDNVAFSGVGFSDDFDPALDASMWSNTSTTQVNTRFGGSGNSLFFTGNGVRQAVSNALAVAPGATISFDLIFGNSSNGGENPDGNEDMLLEYSGDGGQTWTLIRRYDEAASGSASWQTFTETLPSGAEYAAPEVVEGNSGVRTISFPVARAGFLDKSSTVSYQVVGVGPNAANAGDFPGGVFPSGIVTFAAGQTAATVAVGVRGDLDFEADERFELRLVSNSGGEIGNDRTTGLIVNDDTAATIDLAGSQFDAPGSVVAGDSFSVDFDVTNSGTGAANAFDVAVYISSDGVIDGVGDTLLGTASFAGLAAGASLGTQTLAVTSLASNDPIFSGGYGTFTIGAIVDVADTVSESNEGNNANVAAGLDLDTTTFTAPPQFFGPELTHTGRVARYVETLPPTQLYKDVVVFDGDDDIVEVGVAISGRGANERLVVLNAGGVTSDAAPLGTPFAVRFLGQVVGTGVATTTGSTLELTVTATTTWDSAMAQRLVRAFGYQESGTRVQSRLRPATLSVEDAGGRSDSLTRDIDVRGRADAQIVTFDAGPLSYIEGDPAIRPFTGVAISDVDGPSAAESTWTVGFADGGAEGDTFTIALVAGSPLTRTGTSLFARGSLVGQIVKTGKQVRITMAAAATLPDLAAALEAVTYVSTSNRTPNALRSIEVIGFGGDRALAVDGQGQRPSIDLQSTSVDDVPVVVGRSTPISYVEGRAATPILSGWTISDDDPAGGTLTIALSGDVAPAVLALRSTALLTIAGSDVQYRGTSIATLTTGSGSLTLSLLPTISTLALTEIQRNVVVSEAGTSVLSRDLTLSVTLEDAGGQSASDTSVVRIRGFAVGGVVSVTPSGVTYIEGGSPVALFSSVSLVDADGDDQSGTRLWTATVAGRESRDAVTLLPTATASLVSGQVVVGGRAVADVLGQGSRVTLEFLPGATSSDVEAAAEMLAFSSSSGNLQNLSREIWVFIRGADKRIAKTAANRFPSQTVTITPTNEVPTFTGVGGAVNYVEGAPLRRVNMTGRLVDDDYTGGGRLVAELGTTGYADDFLGFITKAPGQYNLSRSGDDLFYGAKLVGSVQELGHSVRVQFEADATLKDVNKVLNAVGFATASDNPHSSTRTVAFHFFDGLDDSVPATVDVTVTPTNDAPEVVGLPAETTGAVGSTLAIGSGLSLVDVDSPSLAGGSIIISLGSDRQVGDTLRFALGSTGALTRSGNDVLMNGVVFARFAWESGTGGRVDLLSGTDAALATSLLKTLEFSGTTGGSRTLSIQVSDGQRASQVSGLLTLSAPSSSFGSTADAVDTAVLDEAFAAAALLLDELD